MSLFRSGEFRLRSGEVSAFKIDCDALDDDDIETLARMIAERCRYSTVEGVPTGGLRLAEALRPYATPGPWPLLIVDDVCTTGASLEKQRAGRPAVGFVVFARGLLPEWCSALFVLSAQALTRVHALAGVAPEEPYRIALRPDEDGALDDVVVKDVAMFRLERMDRRSWWLACFLDAACERQVTIWFSYHNGEIVARCMEAPGDVAFEPGGIEVHP